MEERREQQVKRVRGEDRPNPEDDIIIQEFNRVHGIRANMDWTKVMSKVHEELDTFLLKKTLIARLQQLRPSKQALRKEPENTSPHARGKYGHWTAEEDLRLSNAVKNSTTAYTNWNLVCAEFGDSRSRSSLINRWHIIKKSTTPASQ